MAAIQKLVAAGKIRAETVGLFSTSGRYLCCIAYRLAALLTWPPSSWPLDAANGRLLGAQRCTTS
jgi:hypothetical protein